MLQGDYAVRADVGPLVRYWKERLRTPSRGAFLEVRGGCEIRDGAGNLKALAEFVGCPRSLEKRRRLWHCVALRN